jgi:hypothetical protein
MRLKLTSAAALGTALALSLVAPPGAAQNAAKPSVPQAVKESEAAGKVDPASVQALRRMSAYLATLNAFELHTDTTLDLVTDDGHKIQLGGQADYKVRRPNGFQIDVSTDYKNRRFYYDGKNFTMFAPTQNFYATAPAPATIRETLDVLETRYGISLPLSDLFRWNDPANKDLDALSAGFLVGPATVDGTPTDHYAFREGDRDWEIWIQQGAQPLPRKVAITDLTDEARPTYIARLTWNVNPTIAADAFTFRPTPDAKAIRLAASAP